jgi:hypothetical protein
MISVAAALEVVRSLDGTFGKTWERVADELDTRHWDYGLKAEVAADALAELIRALIAEGALTD